MLILFLVFSAVWTVSAKVPACPPGGIYFSPPQNLSTRTHFPPTINGSTPIFPTNYVCNYQINVPQGLYATVWISYSTLNKTDENTKVVVTDNSNFSEIMLPAFQEEFYFPSNSGNISLSTGASEVSFDFGIWWRELPTVVSPKQIQLNVSNTEPSTIQIHRSNVSYLVTAETRVSILAISSIFDFDNLKLRGIFIYDGPTWNSTLLGSAMHLWSSNKQWVSTGKQLTVQLLFDGSNANRTQMVLQDYENSKHIVNYYCGYCTYVSNVDSQDDCQYTLDNSLGTSAVITSMNPEYGNRETIKYLDGNGTLDVYLGGITQSKSNLVVSYPVNDPGLTLPQTFRGAIRTYVLEGVHTKAVMNLTRYFSGPPDTIGTKKLIMSDYYPQVHTDQYVWGTATAPNNTLVTFSYILRCADITKNGTFRVQVRNGNKYVYNKTYTASNPPPIGKTFNVIGDYMSVLMQSKEGESQGLLMEYEILKAASTNFCILVFPLILVTRLF